MVKHLVVMEYMGGTWIYQRYWTADVDDYVRASGLSKKSMVVNGVEYSDVYFHTDNEKKILIAVDGDRELHDLIY